MGYLSYLSLNSDSGLHANQFIGESMSYGEFFDHKSSFLWFEVVSQGVMCLSRLLHDFPINVVLVCFISFPVNNNISNSANGNCLHARILEIFSRMVARNALYNLHFFHVKYVQLYVLELAFNFYQCKVKV